MKYEIMPAGGKMTLLLVTQNKRLIERLEQRMSMAVVTANDVPAARALVAECLPSCVIIDFSVGQEDALLLAAELRETQREVMTIGLLDRGDKLLPAV